MLKWNASCIDDNLQTKDSGSSFWPTYNLIVFDRNRWQHELRKLGRQDLRQKQRQNKPSSFDQAV